MIRLQHQLHENLKEQEANQQQASEAKAKPDQLAVPGQKQASETALEKLKADGQIAATQLAQFNQLKNKLIKIYQMQGFKSMVKSNPNMSRFLGVVRQDLIREEGKDEISA